MVILLMVVTIAAIVHAMVNWPPEHDGIFALVALLGLACLRVLAGEVTHPGDEDG